MPSIPCQIVWKSSLKTRLYQLGWMRRFVIDHWSKFATVFRWGFCNKRDAWEQREMVFVAFNLPWYSLSALWRQSPRRSVGCFGWFFWSAVEDMRRTQVTVQRKNVWIAPDSANAAQHERVVGGTQQISEILGQRLSKLSNVRIYKNSYVYFVQQDATGTVAHYCNVKNPNNTQLLRGRFLVMTVPPPLAARIQYEPPLPAVRDFFLKLLTFAFQLRDQLCQHMKMGKFSRCF
jgi:hypothetical protein